VRANRRLLQLNHCYLKAANRHRIAWEREKQGPSSRNDNSVVSSFDDDREKFFVVDDDYNDNDEEEYKNYKDIDAGNYL